MDGYRPSQTALRERRVDGVLKSSPYHNYFAHMIGAARLLQFKKKRETVREGGGGGGGGGGKRGSRRVGKREGRR